MIEGARAGIGNGEETRFWTGKWLDSGVKLIDLVSKFDEPIDLEDPVKDFITEDGNWDLPRLRLHLDDEAIKDVIGMLPPHADRGPDTWTWGSECNGRFTIRSAYEIITKPINQRLDTAWELVWKWSGPSRVQYFLWLVAHEKLLTNLERKRRHLSADATCSRCTGNEESVLHVVRDCTFAGQVWDLLGIPRSDEIRTCVSIDRWLRVVLQHDRSTEIGIMCWYLWKARNESIFNNSNEPPESLASRIKTWSSVVKDALSGAVQQGLGFPSHQRVEVAWKPGPVDGWVLNTDGSVLPTSGSAAAGGLLRDGLGRCTRAFTVNLGRCSITRAELRGILVGLDVVWEVGIRKVEVQVDSRVAIALIYGADNTLHQHASEVSSIRALLQRDWEVTISHVYREGNYAADYLADIGHSFPPGFHSIDISDCTFGYFLRRDCMGIAEPRMISS
ncbi:Putative ribonuclease H protein At1g65750 [Linum perenne]